MLDASQRPAKPPRQLYRPAARCANGGGRGNVLPSADPYAARHRRRESVVVDLHTIGLPVFVLPVAPSDEQNAPPVTMPASGGDAFVEVVAGAGFVEVGAAVGTVAAAVEGAGCVVEDAPKVTSAIAFAEDVVVFVSTEDVPPLMAVMPLMKATAATIQTHTLL